MASEWRMKINLRVKSYLNVASFFVLANDRIRALLPRQADVHAETIFRSGAFVPGLHDAGAGTGDDHEAGLGNLAPEVHGLLVFHLVRLRPGRAENRDLADAGIRREEAEGKRSSRNAVWITRASPVSFTSASSLSAFSMMSATWALLWPPPLKAMSSSIRHCNSKSAGLAGLFPLIMRLE